MSALVKQIDKKSLDLPDEVLQLLARSIAQQILFDENRSSLLPNQHEGAIKLLDTGAEAIGGGIHKAVGYKATG